MTTQAQQIAELASRIAEIEKHIKDEAFVRGENHQMIAAMHTGLMVPQPGQDGKSLLERMANVTVRIESGERTAVGIMNAAKWLVALAAAFGIMIAALKWGAGR